MSESIADRPADLTPRVRWAAIIWGLAMASIAGLALWVTASAERRLAVADWTLNLSPAAAAAYLVLAVGAVALVGGLVGLARRAQRGLERRSTASPADAGAPAADEM